MFNVNDNHKVEELLTNKELRDAYKQYTLNRLTNEQNQKIPLGNPEAIKRSGEKIAELKKTNKNIDFLNACSELNGIDPNATEQINTKQEEIYSSYIRFDQKPYQLNINDETRSEFLSKAENKETFFVFEKDVFKKAQLDVVNKLGTVKENNYEEFLKSEIYKTFKLREMERYMLKKMNLAIKASKASKNSVDATELLNDKKLFAEYNAYEKSKLADESSNFLKAYLELKAIYKENPNEKDKAAQEAMMKDIYNTYIKVGADQELNIKDNIRKVFESSGKILTLNLFEDVKQEIVLLLNDENYKNFIERSGNYKKFKQDQFNPTLENMNKELQAYINESFPEESKKQSGLFFFSKLFLDKNHRIAQEINDKLSRMLLNKVNKLGAPRFEQEKEKLINELVKKYNEIKTGSKYSNELKLVLLTGLDKLGVSEKTVKQLGIVAIEKPAPLNKEESPLNKKDKEEGVRLPRKR